MIKTVLEYKKDNSLTWQEVANRFGAGSYQDAQYWNKSGFLVIEHNGKEKLVSVRRMRDKRKGDI